MLGFSRSKQAESEGREGRLQHKNRFEAERRVATSARVLEAAKKQEESARAGAEEAQRLLDRAMSTSGQRPMGLDPRLELHAVASRELAAAARNHRAALDQLEELKKSGPSDAELDELDDRVCAAFERASAATAEHLAALRDLDSALAEAGVATQWPIGLSGCRAGVAHALKCVGEARGAMDSPSTTGWRFAG